MIWEDKNKMAIQSSHKGSKLHSIISKDSSRLVITVSIAVFIVAFCLVAAQSIFSQIMYQNKIISEKKSTLAIVEQNKLSASELAESYLRFATEPINVLGGSPQGSGAQDGDNAKIVLDALPDALDFPALSSSIEKILLDGGYAIQSIGGGGSQNSSSLVDSGSATGPQPIPYPIRINSTPESTLSLLQSLEASIRPFKVTSLRLEGSASNLETTINLETYYQEGTGLQVGAKVVN